MRLEEKYAHVTEELVSEMTLEQLEDLRYAVGEDRRQIEMSLELLEQQRGVSRDMAAQFSTYLPQTMALESFTSFPTTTNYEMVKESLSAGLKVAIAVGLVASFGVLVWWFTKASNNNPATPNEKGAAVLERNTKAIKPTQKKIAEILKAAAEEDVKSSEPATAPVYKEKITAYEHKRMEEARMREAAGSLNKYTFNRLGDIYKVDVNVMGRGKPVLIPEKLLSDFHLTASVRINGTYKHVLLPAIDAAEKYHRSQHQEDLDKLVEKLRSNGLDDRSKLGGHPFDGLIKVLEESFGRGYFDNMDVDASVKKFVDWAEEPVGSLEGFQWMLDKIIMSINKDNFSIDPPKYDDILRKISKDLTIGHDLTVQEKRVKALTNVPKEIQALLSDYVEDTKSNVKAIDHLKSIIGLEIRTYNNMLKFVNRQVVDTLEVAAESLRDIITDGSVHPRVKAMADQALSELSKMIREGK